jgi:Domain of unknown function (DUF1707)
VNRHGKPAALTARRQQRGGAMTYAGSAQRIFMMRRRADSRAQELVLTGVAVTLVVITWTLITLRLFISWLLSEMLESRRDRKLRVRDEQRQQRRPLGDRIRAREGQPTGPATRLLERTASATEELVPAVEAMAAAWHRGKHAASQQVADRAGSSRELVGDADREGVIDELQRHMVAGRITVEELEDRVAVAHVARTRGELDRAREHLPRVER